MIASLPLAPNRSTDSGMTTEPGDSESPEPGPDNSVPVPAAIAATEDPVQLTVALIEDERIPEGMVCMGSYRNGRLVARSVMPPEAWEQIAIPEEVDSPAAVVTCEWPVGRTILRAR